MDGPYQSRTKWFYEKFAKSFDNLQPKKTLLGTNDTREINKENF